MPSIRLRGKFSELSVLVDEEDYDMLAPFKWLGQINGSGSVYASSTMTRHWKAQRLLMHRVITGAPDGKDVDHANGDTLDNRRSNLRICTRSENLAGHRRKAAGSSRYRGVHWERRYRRWYAAIKVHQRPIWLGSFAAEDDAARAYDVAAQKYFGAFAYQNFKSAR